MNEDTQQAGSVNNPLHICSANGCTKEGTIRVYDNDGTEKWYCDIHYKNVQTLRDVNMINLGTVVE